MPTHHFVTLFRGVQCFSINYFVPRFQSTSNLLYDSGNYYKQLELNRSGCLSFPKMRIYIVLAMVLAAAIAYENWGKC